MVFVFGSNLAGIHGAGSALAARRDHGAINGRGVGRMGDAYAIPTKDADLKVLPLGAIAIYVQEFLDYASMHPELQFNVVKVGCGLAGYTDADMAPMFRPATKNVHLPVDWIVYNANDKDIIKSPKTWRSF